MPFLLRHAKIICVSLALFKTNAYLCSAKTMMVVHLARASVIAQRFRLGVFYAHKNIGGCHFVQFVLLFGEMHHCFSSGMCSRFSVSLPRQFRGC